jgi:hypothetical protein
MPLRKSPVRTPALLAANHANARKFAGPRTPMGMAQACSSRFKHADRRTDASDEPSRVNGQSQTSALEGDPPGGGLFVFEPKSPGT